MSKRRHNGEGSVYPYESGFRGYTWVTTPSGRRKRKYVAAKTREDVLGKLQKIRAAADKGPVETQLPTLAVFLEGWLEDVVRPTLAPSTVANYDLFVRRYIVPDLGAKRLDRLSVRDVQTWVNKLRIRCQCCAQGKDAARRVPVCCAVGSCCRQIPRDWTVSRHGWFSGAPCLRPNATN